MNLKRSLASRLTGATALVALIGATGLASIPAYADDVAPPAPTNFQITPNPVTNGGAVLTWNAANAPDVAYYQIFRSPGNAAPAANELTYIGRTEDGSVVYVDTPVTEGLYQYAVIAVDTSGNASQPSAWAGVTLDLLDNGAGVITPDTAIPTPAADLATATPITKSRTVTLTWTRSTADDVWRQLVYRANGTAAPALAGYVAANSGTFVDVLDADGTYTYYVVTQDKAGNASPASNSLQMVVDTVAPVVQITAPAMGNTYAVNTAINITADIIETGSGYDAAAVRYYLDGQLLSMPVINTAGMATGLHTVTVEVTDRAGNASSAQTHFFVGTAGGTTASPQNLTAPALTRSRTVTLTWQAPAGATPTQYHIYRLSGSSLTRVGSATVLQYADTVPADGAYTYYVVAEFADGVVSQPSNLVNVTVDATKPVITITSPGNGEEYEQEGTLEVDVEITDAGAGFDAAQVKLFLDGEAFTGTEIDLEALEAGEHIFRVEVTDRAGNRATKQSKFEVKAADDDDDDDDEDDETDYEDLLALLVSLQDEIHHGHFKALLAKLQAGNIDGFRDHIIRHRGKFISRDAADQLLEALEELDWDDDDRDDDEEDWGSWSAKPGKGNKGGKGKW